MKGVGMLPEVRKLTRRRGNAGFTLLELVVVIVVVAILFLVAIDKYLDLLVDVERTAMEQTVGILRSAVALQMAGHIVRDDLAAVEAMAGTNPMAYLSELPKNYLGELERADPASVQGGWWYFDRQRQELVYRVTHQQFFTSPLEGAARARFRIEAVVDRLGGESSKSRLVGMAVRPLEQYRWLKQAKD